MTTQQVADKLIHYWRTDKIEDAITELYPSNENSKPPQFLSTRTRRGQKILSAKSPYKLMQIEEFHDTEISDPIIMGDYFCFRLTMNFIIADIGQSAVKESWVFEVKDGKIVFEKFFHCM
jgi:hypothetical protein